MDIYKLVGLTIDEKSGKAVASIKIKDTPKGNFNKPLVDLVKDKKMLECFTLDDITTLVSFIATENSVNVNETRKIGAMKFLPFFSMLFIVTMIASNIGSSKLASIFGLTMTGGILSFNLSYIIGDIITEVYGYKRARQLIWGGLVCNLLMMGLLQISIMLPPSQFWHHQAEYELILNSIPRILLASLISYTFGEFTNSYILTKLKLRHKKLYLRIIISTLMGIFIDTLLFVIIAFGGTLPLFEMIFLATKIYFCKFVMEFGLIFFTLKIISLVKKYEEVDIIDINTDLTPFSFDVEYANTNNIYKSVH